jgi:hypothetical protein
VSNAASAVATSGAVTVTETVPSGLTLVSMTGTGWTCASGGNSCTRSDALAAGAGYPAITVVVKVKPNASSPQVNQVSVSGGGSPTANATDSASVSAGYLTGDVYPRAADTVSNFGDGSMDILDLIQELFAVNNIPTFRPPACSDRFDAMDLFPVDTTTVRGGDGALDILDLIRALLRVNNLDSDRPMRSARGGVCGSGGSTLSSSLKTVRRGGAAPVSRAAVSGALIVGDATRLPDGGERIAVYLAASRNLDRLAVTLGLGDGGSQLRFEAAPDLRPSISEDGQPGVVAVAWLDGLSVRAGERLVLGYVNGPAGLRANLRIHGVSAASLIDNTAVRIEPQPGAGAVR